MDGTVKQRGTSLEPFSESLAKQLRILQRQGVVVDGGDQTLLEIHSVISATT